MEVRKGIIYLRMYTLDDVPIDSDSFAVIKADMVHENTKNLNLEVPPDDMTLTLWDAVTRRVHWRRTSIDVDPAAISVSTTPSLSQQHTIPSQSQLHTIPSLSPPQNTPSQSQPQTTPSLSQQHTIVAAYHSMSVVAIEHSKLVTVANHSNYAAAADNSYSVASATSCADNSWDTTRVATWRPTVAISTADTKYPPSTWSHAVQGHPSIEAEDDCTFEEPNGAEVVKSQAIVAAAVKRQAKANFNSHDIRTPKISKGKADVKCQRALWNMSILCGAS
jgi:hypothetical protein